MYREIEIQDVEFDNGYGVQSGDLNLLIKPLMEGHHVDDIVILDPVIYLTGNNGVEIGEILLDTKTVYSLVKKEELIQKVADILSEENDNEDR